MVRLMAAAAGAEVVDHRRDRRRRRGHPRGASSAAWRATCWSSPAASRSARTTTSSPRSRRCGVEEVFWRVRIKPGKPLWFGRRGETLVFGLPGNPLSAIVGTALFVAPRAAPPARRARRRPALRARPPRRARRPVGQPHDVPDLASSCAAADGVLVAYPTERQGSHMTGALGESDGFAVAPHGSGPLPAGAEVDLLRPRLRLGELAHQRLDAPLRELIVRPGALLDEVRVGGRLQPAPRSSRTRSPSSSRATARCGGRRRGRSRAARPCGRATRRRPRRR